MKKYLFLAACILSQGSNAQVELNVTLNDQEQTVVLDENQQETCTFGDLNIVIQSIKENEDSVVLELTIGELSPGQVTIKYGENVLFDLETSYQLGISASKN